MNTDKMILAKGCVCSTDSSKTGLNNNVIVCGCSGCGKTMSVSEPRLLETYYSSLVVTVTKRRIVSKYKRMFEERGYEVQDLNFADPTSGDIGYDPLAYVKTEQDITFLAKSIVNAELSAENSRQDPYWNESAASLLSAEIAYTKMTKPHATFSDVLEMHDALDYRANGMSDHIRTTYDQMFDTLDNQEPSCFAVRCWRTFQGLPYKTAACVYSMLNTALDTVFNDDLRMLMRNRHKVNFADLATRKTVLFVTTSPVNPVLNSFINIFYGHVFKELFEFAEKQPSGVLPIPVHVLCDDFATGGRVQNFSEYISIFREKRLSVTLLLQSESQLASMYGSGEATTIINNCDTYLYMGGTDIETARNISTRLNAPLDEVLYMPVGRMVVFRRGQQPIVTERYNIRRNRKYQEITKMYEKSLELEQHTANEMNDSLCL